MPTLANYITRPIWQVPGWYVATLDSNGFQTRATVVEGGTLVLANSKPSVTSLGPLTVKRQPPRQGSPPLAVTSLVTDSRVHLGSLRVQLHSRGHSPLMSRLCSGWGLVIARVGWRCPPLICPTRPLSTEGPVGPLGHETTRVYGMW